MLQPYYLHRRGKAGAGHCDERVSLFVCVFVCMPCISNHTSELHRIFYACCLWPWLGPPLGRLDTLCTSGSVSDIMLFDSWSYGGVTLPQKHAAMLCIMHRITHLL